MATKVYNKVGLILETKKDKEEEILLVPQRCESPKLLNTQNVSDAFKTRMTYDIQDANSTEFTENIFSEKTPFGVSRPLTNTMNTRNNPKSALKTVENMRSIFD